MNKGKLGENPRVQEIPFLHARHEHCTIRMGEEISASIEWKVCVYLTVSLVRDPKLKRL